MNEVDEKKRERLIVLHVTCMCFQFHIQFQFVIIFKYRVSLYVLYITTMLSLSFTKNTYAMSFTNVVYTTTKIRYSTVPLYMFTTTLVNGIIYVFVNKNDNTPVKLLYRKITNKNTILLLFLMFVVQFMTKTTIKNY